MGPMANVLKKVGIALGLLTIVYLGALWLDWLQDTLDMGPESLDDHGAGYQEE